MLKKKTGIVALGVSRRLTAKQGFGAPSNQTGKSRGPDRGFWLSSTKAKDLATGVR